MTEFFLLSFVLKNGEFAYLHFHDMKRSDYKIVEAYGFRDYLEELYWELEDKIKKILAFDFDKINLF